LIVTTYWNKDLEKYITKFLLRCPIRSAKEQRMLVDRIPIFLRFFEKNNAKKDLFFNFSCYEAGQ